MADSREEPRLNSVDRFSKKSRRLLLEEHDHCEVPAGCGGIVLRWINPEETLPLLLWFYTPCCAELLIDGRSPTSARPLVKPGRKVLALRLFELQGRAAFTLAALRDSKERGRRDEDPVPLAVSAADGTWRFTASRPADDAWLRPGFDDSAWSPLETVDLHAPEQHEKGWWNFERLGTLGAAILGVETDAPEIRVRKEFDLPGLKP